MVSSSVRFYQIYNYPRYYFGPTSFWCSSWTKMFRHSSKAQKRICWTSKSIRQSGIALIAKLQPSLSFCFSKPVSVCWTKARALLQLEARGRFVEQKLPRSCSFRCDQIYNNHCYVFGPTLLCSLSQTWMFNKPTSVQITDQHCTDFCHTSSFYSSPA